MVDPKSWTAGNEVLSFIEANFYQLRVNDYVLDWDAEQAASWLVTNKFQLPAELVDLPASASESWQSGNEVLTSIGNHYRLEIGDGIYFKEWGAEPAAQWLVEHKFSLPTELAHLCHECGGDHNDKGGDFRAPLYYHYKEEACDQGCLGIHDRDGCHIDIFPDQAAQWLSKLAEGSAISIQQLIDELLEAGQ